MPTTAQQPTSTYQSAPFGPWVKGCIDSGNPSVIPPGALREAEHFILQGAHQLSIRPGMVTALTLYPLTGFTIDSVLYVGTFTDYGIALAYSAFAQAVYLYLFTADMQNFFDLAGVQYPNVWNASAGGFYNGPFPCATVWTGINAAPDVLVTEGLGYLYIANTVASDKNGLYWPTKYWDGTFSVPQPLNTLTGSGTYDSSGNFIAGTDPVYFNGVISYNTALWGWGFGAGTSVATAYRPEMARFSPPDFGALALTDSITLGDRVRSARERIVGGAVAGQSLFLGGDQLISRVVGYGRNSWYKTPIDRSFGFVGPKCMVTVGTYVYYWSPHGPMRIDGYNPYSLPEPLWDAVQGTVASVINPSKIVAAADLDRDQVMWFYDKGSGIRTFCAYDYRRQVWLGPAADFGLAIQAAGSVRPLYASVASSPAAPAGPPTSPATINIGAHSATATWTAPDNYSQLEVSFQNIGSATWGTFPLLAASTTSYIFSGLQPLSQYQWRVRAFFNGVYSAYLGPQFETTFTTLTTGVQLPPPSNLVATYAQTIVTPFYYAMVSWRNILWFGNQVEVWSRNVFPNAYGQYDILRGTAAPGQASLTFTLDPVADRHVYAVEIRNVETAYISSAFVQTTFQPFGP